MFSFFRKKEEYISPVQDWSFISTDIHSHVMYGIDDGAKTVEDTISLVKAMYNLGFRKMVTTPHVSQDIYRNTKKGILQKLAEVRKIIADQKIDMEIDAAAEYMIDENFIALSESDEKLLTLYENRVLVEMSFMFETPYLSNALFIMQTRGYQPVLAHPERYNFYHHQLEKYDELKEKGCLFQLNMISFSGYYGEGVKKTAEYLFEKKMYDYCGSDVHHLKHINALNSLQNKPIMEKLSTYPFLNKEIPQRNTTEK